MVNPPSIELLVALIQDLIWTWTNALVQVARRSGSITSIGHCHQEAMATVHLREEVKRLRVHWA
jgi:hypothetical protein